MKRSAHDDRQAAVILRLRARAEKQIVSQLTRELARGGRAYALMRTTDAKAQAIASHRARLAEILKRSLLPLATVAGAHTAEMIAFDLTGPFAKVPKTGAFPKRAKAKDPEPISKPVKPSEDTSKLTHAELVALVVGIVARLAGDLSEATRQQAEDAIVAGIEAGEDETQIAQRVQRATGGAVAGARAARIARTAVTSVSGAAGKVVADAKLTNRVKTKQWWTAQDDRVRPTHRAAHRQTVTLDERFSVGFSRLDFPGDPLGPPEEVINCRCVVLYGEREA